ncbi:hypothetical protein ACLB1O_09210 [Escherichia coli]
MDDSHKKHHNLKPAQAGFLLSALNILLKYEKILVTNKINQATALRFVWNTLLQ